MMPPWLTVYLALAPVLGLLVMLLVIWENGG